MCLTYLNFEDFNYDIPESSHTLEDRFPNYPFRSYAVDHWFDDVADNLDDAEYFSLLQKLFNPSKPNTFISWMHDIYVTVNGHFGSVIERLLRDEDNIAIMRSGFAEVTALHYAALLQLTKICSWLIESGCDVNRNTKLGTPLHFAMLRWWALFGRYGDPWTNIHDSGPDGVFINPLDETFDFLLGAGADPNCDFNAGIRQLSPLFMTLSLGRWNQAIQLLDKGGTLDNNCLEILEKHPRCEDVSKLLEHAGNHNVVQENRERVFQLALRAKTPNAARLVPKYEDVSCQNTHYEQNLRTAAEYGQAELILDLLEDQSLDINGADERTGLTALHHAAKTSQLGVSQILLDRGADLSRLDNSGRTALYLCVLSRETHCLQLFLQKGADTMNRDLEGITIWHLAAQVGNLEALSVLLSTHTDSASVISLKTNNGRTVLACASENGNVEAMSLLLGAGSDITDTDSDGNTPLHYAVKSGSLEAVELLAKIAPLQDVVALDGSTALHHAVAGSRGKVEEIVRVLIENGVEPCKARSDGYTSLHVLVDTIRDETIEYDDDDDDDQLFAAGVTLMKKILENSGSASDLKLGSELIYLACSHHFSRAHEVVSTLLNLGLESNVRFADGRTALMAAAENGNDEILKALLIHGADPCITDDSGSNALHFACFNGHKSILVLLRNTSIDWNKESTATIMDRCQRKKVTPLHIAAQSRDSRVLEYLLSAGLTLSINACTDKGETPLSMAVLHSTPKNVFLLLSKEADTTVIDSAGYSAVHWAALKGEKEVVSEFIKFGSNLGLPDRSGLSAELLARKYGHEALAKIIMQYVNESEFHRFVLVMSGWISKDIPMKTMNQMPSCKIGHQAKHMGDPRL